MDIWNNYLLACVTGNDEVNESLGVLTEHFLTFSDSVHWFLWVFIALLSLIAGLLIALLISKGFK